MLGTIDDNIFEQARKAKVAKGFEMEGVASHVLLAACLENESAYESNGRGDFTSALLALLRDPTVAMDIVSYLDLIERLPELPKCVIRVF